MPDKESRDLKVADTSSKAALKYLFVAVYKDGSHFQQNPEDVSAKEPNRSAFFDVDQENLQAFFLVGPTSASKKNQHTYLVDLTDGHFEIDGVPFGMDPRARDGSRVYKLAFFRKHRANVEVNVRSGKMGRQWEDPIVYCLGWNATDQLGQVAQRIMEID
jgi:hypothetical protein